MIKFIRQGNFLVISEDDIPKIQIDLLQPDLVGKVRQYDSSESYTLSSLVRILENSGIIFTHIPPHEELDDIEEESPGSAVRSASDFQVKGGQKVNLLKGILDFLELLESVPMTSLGYQIYVREQIISGKYKDDILEDKLANKEWYLMTGLGGAEVFFGTTVALAAWGLYRAQKTANSNQLDGYTFAFVMSAALTTLMAGCCEIAAGILEYQKYRGEVDKNSPWHPRMLENYAMGLTGIDAAADSLAFIKLIRDDWQNLSQTCRKHPDLIFAIIGNLVAVAGCGLSVVGNNDFRSNDTITGYYLAGAGFLARTFGVLSHLIREYRYHNATPGPDGAAAPLLGGSSDSVARYGGLETPYQTSLTGTPPASPQLTPKGIDVLSAIAVHNEGLPNLVDIPEADRPSTPTVGS